VGCGRGGAAVITKMGREMIEQQGEQKSGRSLLDCLQQTYKLHAKCQE